MWRAVADSCASGDSVARWMVTWLTRLRLRVVLVFDICAIRLF
jgi:hypothetical protein